MEMITSRANINPDLLIWARKTVGLDIEKSAKKISIKPDLLEQWESGEKKPTINQLRKIANLYKRSFAVFFLPNPPSIPSIPMDFRLLPENLNQELSYETLVDIRVSIRKREIALDLANSINRETETSFSTATLKNDPEKLAQRERDFFNIDVQTQFNQKDKYAALKLWKNALEDKKILIFQSSRISINEMRGYSYFDKKLPFIMINSKDSPYARIFSIFHEYCHLLLQNGGICDMHESEYGNNISRIEVFCNHFAAAFLVPKDDLLNEPLVLENSNPNYWSDESIRRLSNRYKVSREVIIRRLTTLGRATPEFYRKKRQQFIEESEVIRNSDTEIKIPYYRRVISWNGEMYTNLVIESYREQKINMSDVADYLGIRLKHFPKIESELLKSGAFT